jgi:hypothetical protein
MRWKTAILLLQILSIAYGMPRLVDLFFPWMLLMELRKLDSFYLQQFFTCGSDGKHKNRNILFPRAPQTAETGLSATVGKRIGSIRNSTILSDKPVGEDGYYMLTIALNIAQGHGIAYNYSLPATGIQPLSTLEGWIGIGNLPIRKNARRRSPIVKAFA